MRLFFQVTIIPVPACTPPDLPCAVVHFAAYLKQPWHHLKNISIIELLLASILAPWKLRGNQLKFTLIVP